MNIKFLKIVSKSIFELQKENSKKVKIKILEKIKKKFIKNSEFENI